ncbi:aminotransferase [Leptotrichia sp. OH3620_COT-345]|uniref:aminotransferase n=1 Tax=Leptotrichia sp. OH3620_COT-345 TaxID=2491048 RepID=UPI000F652B6A|nr:aminotransferase [Leptotrichia sp. OH3620_COT-345]RRD40955.1 aminotransferase [Leptotrichia sp. OH3620_COT-345]
MKIANFGVEEWLNVWENEAVYDIAGSSIASFTLEEIIAIGNKTKEEFFQELIIKKMNYGWIEGSPEFKKQVSMLYKNVSSEQILQTNGATGANFMALYALVEPDDHIISLYPTYQQLYDIPRSLGAEVDLWRIKEENEWLPDLNELNSLIRSNTKMICINNANNPTGAIMNREFLEELVKIAEKYEIYILSDEVYKPLENGLEIPAIVDLYNKGISINSLSKTYSVPGIRVGWTAANLEITDLFRKYRDYTMICAGVFDDYLATYVLKNKNAVLKRNQKIVSENLQILKEWIKKEPRVSVIFPRNVSTSFIKLDIPMETEKFCINLLKEKGVLLVPGNRFDMPGYARLGYCTYTETLKKGLEKLSEYLREFDK